MRMRPHALNPGQGELMTKKAWGSRKWDPFPLDRLWTKIWGTCSEASARSASIKNDTLNNGGLATNTFYPSIASSLGGLIKYNTCLFLEVFEHNFKQTQTEPLKEDLQAKCLSKR